MATKTDTKFQPASNNPDDFSLGRADKFVGVITSALNLPYRGKNSKDGKFYCTVGLRFMPEEDSGYEPFTELYQAGFLNEVIPSKDGENPAGASIEDYLALAAGKGDLEKPCVDGSGNVIESSPYVGPHALGQYSKKRSWRQFGEALRDADEKSVVDSSAPGLGYLVGLKCRFDRVRQTGVDGQPLPTKEGEQGFTVLVPTTVYGYVDKKGKSAASSKKAQETTSASDNGSSELEDRIKEGIISALKAADGGKLKKGSLISKVSKGFDKSERAEAMSWISEDENLVDIDGTVYDMDEKVLELEG